MKWIRSGIFLAVLITTATAAPTSFADEDDPLRLPKSSVPISYDLTLTTNVHTGVRAFSGTVIIEIEIIENTDVLTLHNNGLTIQDLKLFSSGNELLATFTEETDKSFVHVTSSSRSLLMGETVSVEATFTGLLDTSTKGFYRSSYSIEGETRFACKNLLISLITFYCSTSIKIFSCYSVPIYWCATNLHLLR